MYCGDEFCVRCMVYPQGEKHPGSCRPCAVRASGLRGRQDGGARVTKRAIKKRRAELAEALAERGDEDGFRFFDDPASGFELSRPLTEPAVEEEKKRRLPRFRRRKDDEPAPSDDLTGSLADITHLDPTSSASDRVEAPPTESALHEPALHESGAVPPEAAPVDEGAAAPPAGAPASPLGETVDFDEFLGDDAPPPDAVPDQWAFDRAVGRQDSAPPSAPNPADERGPSATEMLARLREAQENGPNLDAFVDPASTDEPHDTPSFDDSPFGTPPPPVVERSADPWVPAASATRTVIADATDSPDLAVNPFGSSEDEADEPADTDAGGNWIPPALRGMTPETERGSLPRRRSDD